MGSKSEDNNGGRSDKMVVSESFKTKQSDVPESSTERCNEGRSDKMVVSASLKTKLSDVPKLTSERCIYRVPTTLRKANEEAYTPQLVSIGPYHRGKPRLQSMEVDKLRYVENFLNKKPEKKVEFYVEELTRLEERARQCYAQPVNLTSNEFVEMLLIDGCFIIEFMLMHRSVGRKNDFRCPQSMEMFLILDMQLMENQLPFFVLEHLYNQINSTDSGNTSPRQSSFLQLASDFFSNELKISQRYPILRTSEYQIKHFLDLYTAYYFPSSPRIPPKCTAVLITPSITELHEAGVKFQNVENNCFLDIKFRDAGGILSIPHIHVTGKTEILLRNVMAFEYFNDQTFYVTDYAILMDSLVNTPNDVALLRTYGIVFSTRSDEEVSHLFNVLCRGTITNPRTFYYSRLCEDVNIYYKKRWNVWRAKLKRDYFNTPWSTLSFIAAVVLLICSLVQSVFSVISA